MINVVPSDICSPWSSVQCFSKLSAVSWERCSVTRPSLIVSEGSWRDAILSPLTKCSCQFSQHCVMENAFILRSFPEYLEPRKMRHELSSRRLITTQIGMLANLLKILRRQDDLAAIVGDDAESFCRLSPGVISTSCDGRQGKKRPTLVNPSLNWQHRKRSPSWTRSAQARRNFVC